MPSTDWNTPVRREDLYHGVADRDLDLALELHVHLGAHVVGAEDPPRRLRKTLALYYAFVFQNLVVRTATMPGELKGF